MTVDRHRPAGLARSENGCDVLFAPHKIRSRRVRDHLPCSLIVPRFPVGKEVVPGIVAGRPAEREESGRLRIVPVLVDGEDAVVVLRLGVKRCPQFEGQPVGGIGKDGDRTIAEFDARRVVCAARKRKLAVGRRDTSRVGAGSSRGDAANGVGQRAASEAPAVDEVRLLEVARGVGEGRGEGHRLARRIDRHAACTDLRGDAAKEAGRNVGRLARLQGAAGKECGLFARRAAGIGPGNLQRAAVPCDDAADGVIVASKPKRDAAAEDAIPADGDQPEAVLAHAEAGACVRLLERAASYVDNARAEDGRIGAVAEGGPCGGRGDAAARQAQKPAAPAADERLAAWNRQGAAVEEVAAVAAAVPAKRQVAIR